MFESFYAICMVFGSFILTTYFVGSIMDTRRNGSSPCIHLNNNARRPFEQKRAKRLVKVFHFLSSPHVIECLVDAF